jgi:hypothetical protein
MSGASRRISVGVRLALIAIAEGFLKVIRYVHRRASAARLAHRPQRRFSK